MNKTDFCGVSDAVYCINDDVYAAIATIENDDTELAARSLNSAIKHTEYTLSRLNTIRDTGSAAHTTMKGQTMETQDNWSADDLPLPEWAERRSDGNYMEPGAQLATRDGRRHGNAYIDSIEPHDSLGQVALVVTDMGNSFLMTSRELEEEFYPPEYVMRKRCHKRKNNKDKEDFATLFDVLEGWIEVREFQQEANEGWCWIVYKRRVVEAYHDHEQHFRFHRWSDNVYMTECITHVMPWYKPQMPSNEK